MEQTQRLHERATIGIITALPKEQAALKLMLEDPQEWKAPGKGAGRRFLLGEIPSEHGGVHVVAVALLSDMGNNQAAITATKLLELLPSVRHLIMSGIAGGIPRFGEPEHDVRLGDIVVSNRNGVVQYDLGKEHPDGTIEHRHPPRPPGAELLEAVRHMLSEEELSARPWEQYLARGAGLKKGERPGDHLNANGDPIEYPQDPAREPGKPRVFHGVIAAANKLLKNPALRDLLSREYGAKAVEMESSGIADAAWTDTAGYLVVRGICDYCDDKKGDEWQGAAAVAAAAYVRALIGSMHVEDTVPARSKPPGDPDATVAPYNNATDAHFGGELSALYRGWFDTIDPGAYTAPTRSRGSAHRDHPDRPLRSPRSAIAITPIANPITSIAHRRSPRPDDLITRRGRPPARRR